MLPEMSAKVAFLERALKDDELEPFLGVPISAVRENGSRQVVFRVNDNRVHTEPIQIGRRWGDTLEARSGVRPGDLVVLQPSQNMKDGTRVRVKE